MRLVRKKQRTKRVQKTPLNCYKVQNYLIVFKIPKKNIKNLHF